MLPLPLEEGKEFAKQGTARKNVQMRRFRGWESGACPAPVPCAGVEGRWGCSWGQRGAEEWPPAWRLGNLDSYPTFATNQQYESGQSACVLGVTVFSSATWRVWTHWGQRFSLTTRAFLSSMRWHFSAILSLWLGRCWVWVSLKKLATEDSVQSYSCLRIQGFCRERAPVALLGQEFTKSPFPELCQVLEAARALPNGKDEQGPPRYNGDEVPVLRQGSWLHFKVLPSRIIQILKMSVFKRMNFRYLGNFLTVPYKWVMTEVGTYFEKPESCVQI